MKFEVWNCSQEALQPLTLCSLVKKKYGLSFLFFSPEYSNSETKQVLLKLKTVRNLLLEIAFD